MALQCRLASVSNFVQRKVEKLCINYDGVGSREIYRLIASRARRGGCITVTGRHQYVEGNKLIMPVKDMRVKLGAGFAIRTIDVKAYAQRAFGHYGDDQARGPGKALPRHRGGAAVGLSRRAAQASARRPLQS